MVQVGTTFRKLRPRLLTILQGFVKSYSSPLFNGLLALLVIRIFSPSLWGEFVKIQLLVTLSSQLCNWSSKNQLMRSFSKEPSTIAAEWRSSFSSRLPLFLVVVPVCLFLGSPASVAYAALWLFARFIILSYEPLILFTRSYLTGTLADLISFVLTIAQLVLIKDLTPELILRSVCIAESIEACVLILLYKKEVWPSFIPDFSLSRLKEGGWLFLLAFSGFAGSRADLLCAAMFLPDKQLGYYQVLINFLLGLQSLSNILILPYIRNYYRLSVQKIKAASRLLFMIGIPITLAASPVIYLVLTWFYKFDVSLATIPLMVLYALPVYYYTLFVYLMLKRDQDATVFFINLSGLAVNVLLSLALLPAYGVLGGIIAASVSHLLALFLFRSQIKRIVQTTTLEESSAV